MCTHPLQCSLHLDLMFNTPSQNSSPVTSPWQNGYQTTLHCFVTEEMAFGEAETHSGSTTGACWALNMFWVLLILLYSKRTDKELAADSQSVGQLFHPSVCKSSKHTRTTVGVKEDLSSVYFTPSLNKESGAGVLLWHATDHDFSLHYSTNAAVSEGLVHLLKIL